MPDFAYRVVTSAGRTLRGVEEAASASALEGAPAARGLYPIEMAVAAGRRTARRRFRSRRADAADSIRYLATLVGANFPLDRALGTVARVTARADVAEALGTVRERVRSGAALAEALGEQPGIFPRLAVGMTRAGERGGHLAEALGRLADHLEREEGLRAQLLSAMLYPLVMLLVGGAAVAVLVLYVLPRFVTLLDDAGVALPRSTALLLKTGAFLGEWWPVLLLAGIAAGLLTVVAYRSPTGRTLTDNVLLRLPIIGPLRQRLAAARLGRSLATLLESGLPILPALDVAADSLTSTAAAGEVLEAREEVRAGVPLATALGRGHAFPYVFMQMVQLGEEGGRLPEMLERAANAAEQDLQRGLERLMRLVEPALIVAFGVVAGFVALSLLQAIYGVRVDAF
jgi:general secretion pathway protein F